ncbi:enoyl-CoA hydratase/carnithine racemase [Mycobacteroides abscessus subsp. abscessus]|nr:enoyl-CoA hydratase/carnithine racemase [Mycobacteroides abscessus subsp. abscessus]
MSTVSYSVTDAVATITLDDGKVNVLSPTMQQNIHAALDQAEQADDVKAVVLAGNNRVLSAGFDLAIFGSGDAAAGFAMLRGGIELMDRILRFPVPVVVAATGPAVAGGSFLLCSGDHRIGSEKTRCQANEVAIGMTVPQSCIEILRMRLTNSAFQRAVGLAATFTGDEARAGGWLDEVVAPENVLSRAQEVAAGFAATLHTQHHLASKLKARAAGLAAIQAGIDGLAAEFGG